MQKYQATVSSRFQTVIPSAVRDSLHLSENDQVVFIINQDKTVHIEKLPSPKEKRKKWRQEALKQYALESNEELWGEIQNEDFHQAKSR